MYVYLKSLGVIKRLLLVKMLGFTQIALSAGYHGFSHESFKDEFSAIAAWRITTNGVCFFGEKGGALKISPSSDLEAFDHLVDFSAMSKGDAGFLGLAVDPLWPENPYVYALLSEEGPQAYQGRLVRVEVEELEDGYHFKSQKTLLEGWCGTANSHSPSSLEFGPDGHLYVSAGDFADWDKVTMGSEGDGCQDPAGEGGAFRSQDGLTVSDPLGFNGTVLKLDVRAEDPGATAEIIATGLRDPYRMAFHPETGSLFVMDDGWFHEELNVIETPGEGDPPNFGWPCYEGFEPQPEYQALDHPICQQLDDVGSVHRPQFVYSGHGNRISGMVFLPEDIETYGARRGGILFADYGQKKLYFISRKAGNDFHWENPELVIDGLAVNDLMIAPDGSIYYSSLSDGLGKIEFQKPAEIPGRFIMEDTIDFSQAGIYVPTTAAFSPIAGDRRLFVANKMGSIFVYDGLQDPIPTLVADLSATFGSEGDQGLLGMALHPDFLEKPYIYVLHSKGDGPGGIGGGGKLVRFLISDDKMVGEPEVLIDNFCAQFESHSIGDIEFGPDGALYLSSGDGASSKAVDYGQLKTGYRCNDPENEGGALRSQDLQSLEDVVGFNGSILRLDDEGKAFPGNPLSFNDVPGDDSIIAYGLRNPWRFTIHPGNGSLYISDVGWDSYEEVNHIPDPSDAKVENFGWPCYEGKELQEAWHSIANPTCEALYASGLVTDPWYQYRLPGGQSASGIQIYTGSGNYPDRFDGALFLSDYAGNWIRAFLPGKNGIPTPEDFEPVLSDPSLVPVELILGPDGYLYYLDIYSSKLIRVVYSEAPVLEVGVDHNYGSPPFKVNLWASSKYDSEGDHTISWDLDDDGIYEVFHSLSESLSFDKKGTYEVAVKATDLKGVSTVHTETIFVGDAPPIVSINYPTPDFKFVVGEPIPFAGFAVDSDRPDNPVIDGSAFEWQVILLHCSADGTEDCHEHFVDQLSGTDEGAFNPVEHPLPSKMLLRATVTEGAKADWSDPLYQSRRSVNLDHSAVDTSLSQVVAPILIEGDQGEFDSFLVQSQEGISLVSGIEASDREGHFIIWSQFPEIAKSEFNSFKVYYSKEDIEGDHSHEEGGGGMTIVVIHPHL